MSANPTMTRLLRAAVALSLPLAFGACDWFTDFKNQPKIEPWEPLSQEEGDTLRAPRGQPQYSVPVTGTFVAGYQISYTPAPGVVDSIGRLAVNPTPPSEASLLNGRKYYAINCAVCHGDTGAGNGPTTQGYGMPSISIIGDVTKGRTDGYIWGMMRNGRGLMPTYNRIEEMDRWDVVNYVRALQGRIPNTAGIGPVGYPGQGGSAVPGYTASAPTRPAPFVKPVRSSSAPAAPAQAGETTTPAAASGATPAAPAPQAGAPAAGTTDSAARPQTKGGTQ